MKKFRILIALYLLTCGIPQTIYAQDLPYAKSVVQELASPAYWGRGYLYNGMEKAAEYIASELHTHQLTPLQGKDYFQHFQYSINTFPDPVEVALNGKSLQPGVDFLITSTSVGRHANVNLVDAKDPKQPGLYLSPSKKILVRVVDKLTWSARQKEKMLTTTEIQLLRSRVADIPKSIVIRAKNVLVSHFHARNLGAIVKGTKFPDQFVVMSAHYDHLGGISNQAYFPGANDNASGVALLLNLAKYYQAHPQPYSLVFLFFAGEEAGLVGSKHFVDHPLIPLKQIKFLTNFDMVGTGDDGATAVNATLFTEQFKALESANAELQALKQIGARGEAANSDHYWFSKAGVPSFFIYTQGGIQAYHDVYDRFETLPFTKYQELFKLMVRFNEKLMK